MVACLLALMLAMPHALDGQRIDNRAEEIYAATGIDEKLGTQIPLDLSFTGEDGQTVTLGELFKSGKPVILVLAYYECPMLCTLVLNGLRDVLQEVSLRPGRDFQIVTVSIDPSETPELAAANRDRYVATLGPEVPPEAWRCLVGDSQNIEALAQAVGFRYAYDPAKGQYSHAAVLHLLTPEGRLSRYLYGIKFQPQDVRLALLEASNGTIGTFVDSILMYCYQYDATSGTYTLAIGIMRLGGVLTMIVLGAFLARLWYKERQRRDHDVAISQTTD